MKKFILPLTVCFTPLSYAAPHDLYLQSQSFGQALPNSVSLSIDAVNDTIDVFDIRESEGITDNSSGDYIGFQINGLYQLHPEWALEGAYWHREIDYSQDTNKLDTALLGVRYMPPLALDKNDSLSLRASIWGNTANALTKSTPTTVNNRTFRRVDVKDPSDFQVQLDAIFSRKLDSMNQINLFGSLGYSKVNVDKIDIQAKYQGCNVNLAVDSNNQYVGHLLEKCKLSNGYIIEDLDLKGNANEYGLDVKKDLNYDSYIASIGGSWNWRYQQFESQLGYQYHRLWRNDIDDRVTNFGNQAIKDNHSIGAKFSYAFTPYLTGYIQGEMYQHNLIGQVPFLYNGVTASRLDKRYGLASLGIKLHSF